MLCQRTYTCTRECIGCHSRRWKGEKEEAWWPWEASSITTDLNTISLLVKWSGWFWICKLFKAIKVYLDYIKTGRHVPHVQLPWSGLASEDDMHHLWLEPHPPDHSIACEHPWLHVSVACSGRSGNKYQLRSRNYYLIQSLATLTWATSW